MIAAGNQIISYPYSWGGGHSPASMRVPPGPSADPGQQENGGPGYDCSSSRQLRALGRRTRPEPARRDRSRPPGRSRTSGCRAPASGSRSTPAPPAGKGTRSSRSPGSCSTPSTAHRPPRAAPARAGSPPPRSPTRPTAARSSPDTPKAYDPPRLLLAVTRRACSGLAGCGSSRDHSATSGATRRASTTSAQRPARPHAAAEFAAAYVRFLDGTGTASGLPDATSSVRALAARAGSIPAARRRGTLVLDRAARGGRRQRQLPADRRRRRAHLLRADRRSPSSTAAGS